MLRVGKQDRFSAVRLSLLFFCKAVIHAEKVLRYISLIEEQKIGYFMHPSQLPSSGWSKMVRQSQTQRTTTTQADINDGHGLRSRGNENFQPDLAEGNLY